MCEFPVQYDRAVERRLCPLAGLPDELFELIIIHLLPADCLAFGATCRRTNKITYEPLVWRRHCVQTYRYWESHHGLAEKLAQPPAQTKWQLLFKKRQQTDMFIAETFEALLDSQKDRIDRMEQIARLGYDAKDFLVRQRDETGDSAEDVLARRFHADAILGQIHRATALEKWDRLHKRQMVRLEEALGAYDLFVLAGHRGDLNDISTEFDRIAAAIRARDTEFDMLSIRRKAIQIAKHLRAEHLVGNSSSEDYHALRNNFISMALFEPPHTSLPLQSVAIYCAVARRLGVNAKPSNYPHHVHAVIEAPAHTSLDGIAREPYTYHDDFSHEASSDDGSKETMHMDPWRSAEETPLSQLTGRLSQMGAPANQHLQHLGAASNFDIALRTGRNLMNSVQEARDRLRHGTPAQAYPDTESAWYAMLWSMLILGDTTPASTLHRRRQCLPYLIEHFQHHFPHDLGLVERLVLPMFVHERESAILTQLITHARIADATPRAPSYRPKTEELRKWLIPGVGGVAHRIGTLFKHRRYGYEGMIVGWDVNCSAEQRSIEQTGVDDLPNGREQPFYNVVLV